MITRKRTEEEEEEEEEEEQQQQQQQQQQENMPWTFRKTTTLQIKAKSIWNMNDN